MEIVDALHELKKYVEEPKQFLGITFGLNKDECTTLLRRIENLLPEQVKKATAITRESERIVGSAKEDASLALERARAEAEKMIAEAKKEAGRIVDQAHADREKLIHESEILKLAKTHAGRTRADAETEAARLKRGADDYALDVLFRLESVVGKVMATIERGKSEMQRPTQPTLPSRPK